MKMLHELPKNHPDRNRPLAGCRYRWRKGKAWKTIKPTFGIAASSYNDLGTAWTDNDVFCWQPEAVDQ